MSNKLAELENKIKLGLEKAYQKMLEFKKRKNSPVIIAKAGKIIQVDVTNINDKKVD